MPKEEVAFLEGQLLSS